ncbi:hypothetical protein BsWGS_17813 [Bradybaena similaris]
MDDEDDPFMPHHQRKPNPKRRTNPLTEKELKNLLSDDVDGSTVLLRIAIQDGTLERLLKEIPLSPEKLILIVKVLAKAIDDPHDTQAQLQAIIEVLRTFIEAEDFHHQIIHSFFATPSGTKAEYIRAVVALLKCSMERFQQIAPKALALVYLSLTEVIESTFKDDKKLNDDKNIIKRLLHQHGREPGREPGNVAERAYVQNDHNINPNMFRELSIIPTTADFDPAEDIVYRANKVKGAYGNINDYLDVQFRLLRADLILPLRQNIMKYLQGGDHKNFRGMQVYTQVRIVRPVCHDKGLCFRLSFDVSSLRRVNWQVSQRLKYGSLLCLSADNFNTYQCAVVENRDAKDLAKGLVDVQFVLNDHGPNVQIGGHEEFMRLITGARDLRYIMVESPTYFEAYKYVLLGLQNFTENNFPFWRYIGQCNAQIDCPEYLQNGNSTYDLRPLVDNEFIIKDNQNEQPQFSDASKVAEAVDILNDDSWPNPNKFSLDTSQFVALQSALTKEFSIIQGPPGTGKTFIGLLVMKALLHNKQIWLGDRERSPILLVCYTNHALDQFLEGILNFYQGSLVRVGSRSKSERLEEFNLRGMRNRARENRTVPIEIHLAKQETRLKMKELKAEIHREAAKLEILEREIVKEAFLKSVMEETHFKTLTRLSENNSVIVRWLGISFDTNKLEDVKKHGNQMVAYQDQARNAFRPEAEGAAHANEQDNDSDEDVSDDDLDLLEMVNTDLPQTRHLDIDDDDDDVEDDDNDLFSELLEGLGEGFLENVKHVNKKLDEADIEAERIRRQYIAFNISSYGEEAMPVGLSKDQKKHWNSISLLKKRYRVILLGHLQKVDRMTEDEVSQVYDVWRLKRSDKWRLYRYWIDVYCRQIRGEIRVTSEQYQQTARRYQEVLYQEDKTILERATIIAMTTTGAARYQGILREIGPKIVLVEEAAEVFEGHVITCLTDQCQHVVLIGDHKQLRPSPSVYKLKTECGLDISLFERLVDNDFPYNSLRYQHRMRPEISRLLCLPELYPDLKDHDEVKKYPDVLRVNGNVCFIQHYEHDSQEHDSCTFTNKYEAEFIIGLCEYILLQRQFRAEQITILSPYAGQIHLIKNLIQPLAKSHKTVQAMKGVKISSVDNYQGNENDIILLSLVRSNVDNEIGFLKANNRICVALSRAKIGFYVVGNFAGMAQSNLIQDIATEAKKLGYLKDHITLSCLRHKEKQTIIRHPKDFNKVSEGGCAQPCGMRLKCGHSCKRVCHADDIEHKTSECNERCRHLCEKCKQYCNEEHRCGEHDICRKLVDKLIPICHHVQKVPCGVEPNAFECREICEEVLPCGHKCTGRCGSKHAHTIDMCRVRIQKTADHCGHGNYDVVCGNSRSQDRNKCPEPCKTELACGHLCVGTCGQCSNQRLHVDCQEKCKKILICGHECQDTCSSCPPCTRPCETACTHSLCPKKCGEVCSVCVEPCSWKCRHESCDELCCQPCERPPCDAQCLKRLPCGHLCSGLCGEKCPRLCIKCDKEKLISESLYGYDGDPTTLFIELECKHVIEVDFMDQWMVTSTATSDDSEDLAIGLKACPVCKSPVRKCTRYSKQIKQMLRLIESVKRKYIGEKQNDMQKRLERVISEIRGPERQEIDRFIEEGNRVMSEVILEAQINQVNLFRLIMGMYKATEECTRRFGATAGFRKILLELDHFRSWILKKRAIFSDQNRLDAELEKDRLTVLLDLCKIRETVTQRNLREKLEIHHVKMLGQTIKELSAYKRANRQAVQEAKAFCEELQVLIPDTHIALTAAEKYEIVRAVNVSKGAWYKCRNGHIYAIGECGQAMEESVCPECKAKIGGANHQLLSDNAWAPDMDEAERPIWDNINADREIAERLQRELDELGFMD